MILSKMSGYIIAAVGAVLALLAFFFLPYAVAQFSTLTSATAFDSSGSAFQMSSVPVFVDKPLDLVVLVSLNSTELARVNAGVWFVAVVAAIIMVLALLLAIRGAVIKVATSTVRTQLLWGAILLIVLAVLGGLIQFLVFMNVSQVFQGYFPPDNSGSPPTLYAVKFDIGAWLFIAGMVVVVLGSVLALLAPARVSVPKASEAAPTLGYLPVPEQKPSPFQPGPSEEARNAPSLEGGYTSPAYSPPAGSEVGLFPTSSDESPY